MEKSSQYSSLPQLQEVPYWQKIETSPSLSSTIITYHYSSSVITSPPITAHHTLPPLRLHPSKRKKESPGDKSPGLSRVWKEAATYSPALHCSTIGAGGLNFSVRNGKRWDPAAITTWYFSRLTSSQLTSWLVICLYPCLLSVFLSVDPLLNIVHRTNNLFTR